ncbi:hypothetical protein EUGRSUZ_H00935 [Eucalyptus grandis]|uniref:Uncharacterized protein n=2 Tax=Eucalyptus grandis TaxID=71139 RepID=A0A059AWI9_EUCGR|nr:hypothetical protein EUGRSUZ_H00935 [Eucalyptus grandis]
MATSIARRATGGRRYTPSLLNFLPILDFLVWFWSMMINIEACIQRLGRHCSLIHSRKARFQGSPISGFCMLLQ